MKVKLLLGLIVFFISPQVFSQTIDSKQDTIFAKMDRLGIAEVIQGRAIAEEKVVGASRSVKKLEDLPITIYVITQEEILRNGYTTLVDVLKMVPGVRVSKPGNGYAGETFLLRGLEGNTYTKILMNNLPIQNSATGSLAIGEQLPIAQVDRIEIIYGPSSAVYGADAMAGVINIITKTPQNTAFAQVNTVTGQFGYRHANFMAGGKIGRDKNIVQYTLYGNRGSREDLNIKSGAYESVYSPIRGSLDNSILRDFEGISDAQIQAFLNSEQGQRFAQTLNLVGGGGYRGSLLNAPVNELPQQSYLVGIKLNYKGLQIGYDEMYRRDHSSIGRQPLFFGYQNPETYIGETSRLFSVNYTKNIGKITLTTNLMYLQNRFDKTSSLATNYNHNGRSYVYQAADDIFGEVLLNYNLKKNLEFTGGISYKTASVLPLTRELEKPFNPTDYEPFSDKKPVADPVFDNFGINPIQFNNFGGFAQIYWTSRRWTVVYASRFDAPSNYNRQNYNRGAIMYKLTSKTAIRASWGIAFKAPAPNISFYSIAVQDKALDSQTGQFGNPTGYINYQVIPSPNLQPERLNSFEVGSRTVFNPNLYLDLSVFANAVQNLIVATNGEVNQAQYPLANPNFPTSRSYFNDSTTNALLTGFQTVFRAKNLVPSLKLNTNIFYTFQIGTETFSQDQGQLSNYRQVPLHTLQWNISFSPFKNWYLNFDNVAMTGWYRKFLPIDFDFTELSRAYVRGYYTLDFTGRYTFNKNFSAYLKVLNVFNQHYGGLNATGFDVDLLYMPQLLRNIQVGVSFKID
jgi:outer membrane receptor protein involved in Fe transport